MPLAIPSTTAITATQYYLNGSTILTQITGDDRFDFFYGENGLLLGFSYNGQKYYYVYNLQTDIIGILDSNGNQVVSYIYDSWGKLLSIDGSAKDTIGVQNPFRYRGYYYDTETGFYYLNSRYYDPMVGRFLNGDAIAGVNDGMSTYNLFTYCSNNPVNYQDGSGMHCENIIDAALHIANTLAVAFGIDTAAIGAFLLMMEDENDDGIYHASFDCWQALGGYNEFYDIIFDIGTDMVAREFPFMYNGEGYTVWTWKGDYINLGAGAEMGLYRGENGHRIVDKSLATTMGMILTYNWKEIINYFPNEKQWWITGFNSNYLNVSADDLFVAFALAFPNNQGMYWAFKNKYNGYSNFTFHDWLYLAIITL